MALCSSQAQQSPPPGGGGLLGWLGHSELAHRLGLGGWLASPHGWRDQQGQPRQDHHSVYREWGHDCRHPTGVPVDHGRVRVGEREDHGEQRHHTDTAEAHQVPRIDLAVALAGGVLAPAHDLGAQQGERRPGRVSDHGCD